MRLDKKLAETIQKAYFDSDPWPPEKLDWHRRILRTGAWLARADNAEIELEKDPSLCSCADPGDFMCRTFGVVEATMILVPKEIAIKIMTLGLP
jgi:hypothetical protein